MNSMKAELIRKYMSDVNLRSDEWSIHDMAQEMRKFLGETPSIDVAWSKDVMVSELTGKAKEIRVLDKISVVFTDTDDRIKKLEFKA
jgi:hypothetical protein